MSDIRDPEVTIASPVNGEVIDLADVPDPVFSSKAVGDGFGIKPVSGNVVSPVDGTVIMVADTGHAIAFETDSGLEVLLHLGIDTVQLKGEPFALKASLGDRVRVGQSIGTMDLDAILKKGKSTTSIVVFTNTDTRLVSLKVTLGMVDAGKPAARAEVTNEAASGSEAAPAEASTDPASDSASGSPDQPTPAAQRPAAASSADDGLTGLDATARDIIAGIGGADNVRSVIHCITRLRFYLKDESLADDAAVTESADVIDVARAGGQYQVVIGPKVAQVYNAVVKQLPQGSGEDAPEEEERERPTTFVGWMKYGFSSLIGVITGSMIPIIGVLAASGILKGILALLTYYKVVGDETDTYKFIDAMSSSMFYFLPIIVGFTAARRLGANPIVVAIIGGVLCFPTLVAMSNPKGEGYHVIAQLGKTVFNADFFGIPVALPTGREGMAYTSTIFPIIVAAWLASRLEPWLERWIPAVIQSMFVPLLEIFIVSALILVVFGPIVMFFSGFIANGINSIITFNYVFAGLVIGALYQSLVIFGLHWAVIPIIAAQLASSGGGESRINAIVSATMIAQGAGALAIWVKSKNPRIRQLAGPATISAMCGVTEPAMYGLNLKYGRVFITASIGGAVGGLLTGLFNVNMWGFTGAFVGFPSFISKQGIDSSFTGFWIASLATVIVGFLCTYFFGFKESDFDAEREVKKVRLGRREPVAE
ncbi:phosphotransferase system, EIIC [Actinobaculum sp. oral taxon 183 str. F0552]|jgi:PTS system, glucose subfamily, IIA component|uniref:glucose PTS transporter subunit IIA n=1 Tax=Actinobaculum sp. oral taxon 183 TaxID=712888 RepID=UPI00039633EF|nr:PTS glucose transporter subunit IIABC [Actinobaculum sp. oral taxon 183]ERH20292.1 phosphotransferase system, EIIC [Actinobaculum sp. oral taxon 183 str. F0552]